MESISPWADLPQDLLRLVIAGLILPADCARFRAVCRSWRSVPSPHRLPWIVLPDGFLMRSQEGFRETISFPANERCIGTTDSWVATDLVNTDTCTTHTYYLHNIFTKTTVTLPELDKIIGNVSKLFKVRKVLMKSPPTGLVAVMTSSYSYPIILVQPGKGVWLPPKPQTAVLSRIIDIAFLEDKLYGITQAEDLISFRIAFDSDGLPTVTYIEPVVKHSVGDHQNVSEESRNNGGDYIDDDGVRVEVLGDDQHNGDMNATIWYLVESRGKLLMVKRQLRVPVPHVSGFTCKVEVFEADTSSRTWLPVSGGLDGHSLFISRLFSKSVFACGDVKEDSIYFFDPAVEVFNMISNTATPPIVLTDFRASCLFTPGSF
ncbi:hypothetical protein ACQ4PT_003564 [Festuca glaucescens]